MYNSIIISSTLFGSVFIFSTSLCLINNILLEKNTKNTKKLFALNGFIFMASGSIFIYGVHKCFIK